MMWTSGSSRPPCSCSSELLVSNNGFFVYWLIGRFKILVDGGHTVSPDYACLDINSYAEYEEFGLRGCGTKIAYAYFITFHLIFSLVIMNLFIASLIETFFENARSEKSAVTKFQQTDILKLWQSYDPSAHGYITFKEFWSLASQFAIIIGVDRKSMMEENTKKSVLKVLNIPIYERVQENNIFCMKFHDVLVNLTLLSVSLKYGVTKYAHFNFHNIASNPAIKIWDRNFTINSRTMNIRMIMAISSILI